MNAKSDAATAAAKVIDFELGDLIEFAQAYQKFDASTQATFTQFMMYNHDNLDVSAVEQIKSFLIEQRRRLRIMAIDHEELDGRLWDCEAILSEAAAR